MTQPISSVLVALRTFPLTNWANPTQLPGGPDNLPSLAYWSWSVVCRGGNVSAAWSLDASRGTLEGPSAWANTTFTVRGFTNPIATVTLDPGQFDGTYAPGVGFSLNGVQLGPWGSRTLANLTPFARALAPEVIRFGVLNLGTILGWNNTTNTPVLNFSQFDRALAFGTLLNASSILTLPVGTWGDGNSLPAGMTLNRSAPVNCVYGSGYLATPAAYARLITPIVNHVALARETVRYWSIGNEMPLLNTSMVDAYIADFNAAERVIHGRLPGVLVGSDVMTSKSYLATFAATTHGVGFLSYHFYPANALTFVHGTYAPPNGSGGAFTDPQLWGSGTNLTFHHIFAPPASAAQQWRNLTGRALPQLDAESNLNAVGGGVSARPGTDPRQQTSFGAAWLSASMIEAARQNVSVVTYFALAQVGLNPTTATSAYGGWGFDLLGVPTNGSPIPYAPYWALRMWSSAIPAGAPGLVVTTSDPNLVRAYAVITPSGASLALVSGVNTSLQVVVRLAHGTALWAGGARLDTSSYLEQYNPVTNSTTLVRSGTVVLPPQRPSQSYLVSFNGYGAATIGLAIAGVPTGSELARPMGYGMGGSEGGSHESSWTVSVSSSDATYERAKPQTGHLTSAAEALTIGFAAPAAVGSSCWEVAGRPARARR